MTEPTWRSVHSVKLISQSKRTALSVSMMLALFVSNGSSAAVRVILRSDYGKGSNPIQTLGAVIGDRIDNFGELLTGHPMGGSDDLVVRNNPEGTLSEVFQCPSVRECEGDIACERQPSYWACKEIFIGTPKELCRTYVDGHRLVEAENFIVEQVIGGAITGEISFFAEGVGELLVDLDDAWSLYRSAKDILEASCRSTSMGDLKSASLNNALKSGILMVTEKSKNEVKTDLEVFLQFSGDDATDTSVNLSHRALIQGVQELN